MLGKFPVFFLAFFGLLAADQLTKAWTIWTFPQPYVGEIQIIDGWLSLTHAQNFGAAFSSLEGQWGLFMVFTVVATVIVLDLLRRLRHDATFMAFVLAMILSGAIGNGLDRLRLGHVTDMIRVYTEYPPLKSWLMERFGTATWPIFNVADSVLLVGIALFLVHYLFLEERESSEEDDAALEESV